MFVVMGATGNTGRATAESLLASGEKIRVVGRDARRLGELTKRGAEAAVGDVHDVEFLTKAFADADGVYALIPPDYTYADYAARYATIADVIATAISNAGVKRVVFLSSLGAQHAEGTGPITGLHRAEARLKQLVGVDVLLLRAGYFMENLYGSIGLIKHQGVNGSNILADTPMAWVDTHDIGAAAAHALITHDFTGVSVRELISPREFPMAEATKIIGAAIGKPGLTYVVFPDADFVAGLVGAGFAPEFAQSFVEMGHAMNTGRIAPPVEQSHTHRGRVTIEQFATGFAAVYSAA